MLNPSLCQLLSQLLYVQLELRPSILKALKTLVDSNVALATDPSVEDGASFNLLTQQEAQENIDVLRSQAESWLAVLFNVYSSVVRDSRGMVGDVIRSWVSIAGEQVRQSSLCFFGGRKGEIK